MANWGVPDFNDVVSDGEKNELMQRARAQGSLAQWPLNHKVQRGYPPHDVQTYCVNDVAWQTLRLAMKGKDTCVKLDMLYSWWLRHNGDNLYPVQVQVGNYLGALRRGGQLDDNNHIRRWR